MCNVQRATIGDLLVGHLRKLVLLRKSFMLFIQITVLFLLFKCQNEPTDKTEWKCTDMDTALLKFKVADQIKEYVEIFYQYSICNKCDLILLKKIDIIEKSNASITIDSYYSYIFNVSSTLGKICGAFEYEKFGECGIYSMNIEKNDCSINLEKNSKRPNVWAILGGILVVSNFEEISLDQRLNQVQTENNKKQRIRSLDTFRGMSLFLMIFVNYGSGGYKFMQHVPWHGITIADFVFPWFLWIMGFTMPMNISSQMKKNKKACVV
ncbi:heparan-alpha-glucosaminide N-acetyltransferase [Brachionus plicatilis]|uniref:Heparan-alpha-glucosaminide N-acetyltransferase n=1 Tax=Brachionus plicatilis TaxID=10195 RepID=A0A3M7PJ76_BRAPC|nr:heparan-alpha-glucosaminide N-acetyltransferase [Brachionus plicatilis]